MKIQTLEHTDVRGKKLYYLEIDDEAGTVFLLNVGEKTLNKIDEMNEEVKKLKRIEENAENGITMDSNYRYAFNEANKGYDKTQD